MTHIPLYVNETSMHENDTFMKRLMKRAKYDVEWH